ncbi:MAG: 3-isopropylmalate dehydratase small subunit [bacterium]|nr:3-isopropylmalate dehydratase small subunit [bacterium]
MFEEKIKSIKGSAIPLKGDDIDTDQIVPARFLKEITFEKMGEYLFCDARIDDKGNHKSHPLNDKKYEEASFLIVGKNFGCGSSREHAPQAVKRYGIKAIIGESFAEIFAGNCKSLGVPTITVTKEEVDMLLKHTENHPETIYMLDLDNKVLKFSFNSISIQVPEEFRIAFIDGTWNATALLAANSDKVKETVSSLPYINNFQ